VVYIATPNIFITSRCLSSHQKVKLSTLLTKERKSSKKKEKTATILFCYGKILSDSYGINYIVEATGKDWLKYIDSDKIELVLLIYKELGIDHKMNDIMEMVDALNRYYIEITGDDKESIIDLSDNPLDDRCIDTVKEMLGQEEALDW
jgi:hypothetical protein